MSFAATYIGRCRITPSTTAAVPIQNAVLCPKSLSGCSAVMRETWTSCGMSGTVVLRQESVANRRAKTVSSRAQRRICSVLATDCRSLVADAPRDDYGGVLCASASCAVCCLERSLHLHERHRRPVRQPVDHVAHPLEAARRIQRHARQC